MKVETLSMVFMLISLMGVVGIFVGSFLVLKLGYNKPWQAFVAGCLTMLIFAGVTKIITASEAKLKITGISDKTKPANTLDSKSSVLLSGTDKNTSLDLLEYKNKKLIRLKSITDPQPITAITAG